MELQSRNHKFFKKLNLIFFKCHVLLKIVVFCSKIIDITIPTIHAHLSGTFMSQICEVTRFQASKVKSWSWTHKIITNCWLCVAEV